MTEWGRIKIDYCTQCRGVWLDRGELGKLIERAQNVDSRGSSREGDAGHERRKRGGFLKNIFDFM